MNAEQRDRIKKAVGDMTQSVTATMLVNSSLWSSARANKDGDIVREKLVTEVLRQLSNCIQFEERTFENHGEELLVARFDFIHKSAWLSIIGNEAGEAEI